MEKIVGEIKVDRVRDLKRRLALGETFTARCVHDLAYTIGPINTTHWINQPLSPEARIYQVGRQTFSVLAILSRGQTVPVSIRRIV